MNAETDIKQKMHVDIFFDTTILKVLIPVVLVIIILYFLCGQTPECKILIYFSLYLSFILLLLKDNTVVEITTQMAIIHRPFFAPIIIDKRRIKDIQIKKNTNPIFRYLIFIILLLLTVYVAYHRLQDVLYAIQGETLTQGILVILYEFWLVFLLMVILYGIWIKLPYSTLLRVDTDKSRFIFYSQETATLKKRIEAQEH
ncbi:hypothetical protein HWN40_13030 [Methanolobus zinderi]|uniref:DUF1673 family protein n=1 Tax=Methanolobus zinderi TaxID=536044 RepID=A0A7D5E994_9EURY|nr:hypothetical protein [Methanolobus zinderi]QLC51078.1 hypothetical protein HWN40_13030 [Methanolobus zinderi]